MKKTVFFAVFLIIAVFLVSCGEAKAPETTAKTETKNNSEEKTPETEDRKEEFVMPDISETTDDFYFEFIEYFCDESHNEPDGYTAKLRDLDDIPDTVVIPSEHNGLPVVDVDGFLYKRNLKTVVIPGSVKTVRGFKWCVNLETLVLQSGTTEIGSNAFARCGSLKNVIVPDTVKKIGTEAFSNCLSLESITLPDSITEIEGWAFCACLSLEKINIPKGLKILKDHLFSECKSLKNVVIPDGIECIENGVFTYCSSLECVYIPKSVEDIYTKAFNGCPGKCVLKIAKDTKPMSWAHDWDYGYNGSIEWGIK